MSASPEDGARYARAVVDVVANAELAILRRIQRHLAAGLDSPEWAQRKLAELVLLRRQLERDLAGMSVEAAEQVRTVIDRAYSAGSALAVGDLDAAGRTRQELPPAQRRAMQRLAEETVATVTDVRGAVLRTTVDAYQAAVAEGAAVTTGGADTRRRGAQVALDRLLGDGIGGFQDAKGRQWRLESYVEMATRTATGRAATAGHTDHLQANGISLVEVSDAPRECPICRPYEGKVLSLTPGVVGAIDVPSEVDDGTVKVTVMDTLAGARARGFQHPNCRHSVSAYLPGASRARAATAEPRGYEDQQQQRRIERHIREWKRRSALALDEPTRVRAEGKVREWQGALREHLDARPGLKRQRGREQIGRAL